MDIEEFKRKHTPGNRGSKLDPFRREIFELKQEGYTVEQIHIFIASQEIDISQEAIRQYIARHSEVKPNRFKNKSQHRKFDYNPCADGIFEKLNGEA